MQFIKEIHHLCITAIKQCFAVQLNSEQLNSTTAAADDTKNIANTEILTSDATNNKLNDLVEITVATQKQFGHYQCNSAMKLAKILGKPPREIANAICETLLNLDQQTLFAKIEIAGPGFINFTLSTAYIAKCLRAQLQDLRQGVAKVEQPKKVIVDFSSPNIAKEMHVGHLRSTIIGDCIARMLSFVGHNVLRLNHVGDWGTQFGMLIAYLKQNFADPLHTNLTLSELLTCYRQAKLKFDADLDFKATSQQEVVKLQAKDPLALAIWQEICHISSVAYREIYSLLDIAIIDRGESFYNDLLPKIVAMIEQQGLLQISDGAKCMFLDSDAHQISSLERRVVYTNRDGDALPLIIQKADGGYNYATTDLAAIYHRTYVEHAELIIYVVDAGQAQHLNMVFAAAHKAGLDLIGGDTQKSHDWEQKSANYKQNSTNYKQKSAECVHVPFGLVLGTDGKKFRTRSGETEKLIDLITTAIEKAKAILQERDPTLGEAELETAAKKLGINAIKYADLANNRTSDYTFSYERMLQFEGNTAAFLSYAYVRTKSIQRKINAVVIDNSKLNLQEPAEIDLALHICQFEENLHAAIQDFLPNRLTDYLFKLSEKFHIFFHHCRVEGSELQDSRLLLCTATAQVLERGFNLLGLILMDKM